jgi:LysM repeat protein
MARHLKHRTSSIKRNAARLLFAGAVVSTPIALAAPAQAVEGGTWDKLAQCESSGKWSTSTGNGFHGGLQFTPSTWKAYGGNGSAQNASREQQIAVAERVLQGQGWGAWPACSRKLGLRGGTTGAAPKAAKVAPKAAAPKVTPKKTVFAQVAPVAQITATGDGNYVVQPGDTLSKIAQANSVPGGWQHLFTTNQGTVSDPHIIYPGQKLNI